MSPYVNEDYREILRAFFATKKARSGSKSDFANALDIKTSYLSQVLANKAHLTTEQVFLACKYFEWNDLETEYMLFCAQKDRCKDSSLKSFYKKQIERIKLQVQEDMTVDLVIDESVSRTYYSSWLIPVIHQYVLSHQNCDLEQIFQNLDQPRSYVDEAIRVLLKIGILSSNQRRLLAKTMDVPYPKSVSLKNRYLQDCRRYSSQKISNENSQHFTQIFQSGENTVEHMKKIIVENLKAIESKPTNSAYMFHLDIVEIWTSQK